MIISVALNGCGYAARIGIRGAVMDEVKNQYENKKQTNRSTKDETSPVRKRNFLKLFS
jgi:hypothetical protein